MDDSITDIVHARNALSVPPQALALLQSALVGCLTDEAVSKNTRALSNIATAFAKLESVRLKCNLALIAIESRSSFDARSQSLASCQIQDAGKLECAGARGSISFIVLIDCCEDKSELDLLKALALRAKNDLHADLDSEGDALAAIVTVATSLEETELLFRLKTRAQSRTNSQQKSDFSEMRCLVFSGQHGPQVNDPLGGFRTIEQLHEREFSDCR